MLGNDNIHLKHGRRLIIEDFINYYSFLSVLLQPFEVKTVGIRLILVVHLKLIMQEFS